jgi:FkbM family methyltransferase
MNKFIKEKNVILTDDTFEYGGCWQRIHGGTYDPAFLEKCFDYITSKNYKFIFDVGANTGQFALFPSLDNTLNIWSFEPQLEIYDILKKNVELNLIKTTKCFNLAFSNKKCKRQIFKPDRQESILRYGDLASGLASLSEESLRFSKSESEEIDCTTIDDFVKDNKIQSLELIKIDTEGSEFDIIIGAEFTLNYLKPDLILEMNETNLKQFGYSIRDLQTILKKFNYKIEKQLSGEDFLYTHINKIENQWL